MGWSQTTRRARESPVCCCLELWHREGAGKPFVFLALSSSNPIICLQNASWCISGLSGSLLDQAVTFNVPVEECPDVPFVEETEGIYNQLFVPSLMNGTNKGNTIVGTYLQAWPYFADSGIPFTLKHQRWGEQWVHSHDVNVAIHVRSPQFGVRPSESYFVKAIAMLRNLTPSKSYPCCQFKHLTS